MKRSFTKPVTFNDGPGKIHAFTTGTVSVKKRFRTAKGGPLLSKLNFILDSDFTEELPIWVWVIEHPEGVYVVDTGENAQVSEPDYFQKEGPVLSWLNRTQFRFQVPREEEVDVQLKRLGLSPQQVSNVLMTHLHLDHIDGLKHFSSEQVLINTVEWEKPSFALPSLYPHSFKPKTVAFAPVNKVGLDHGYAVTRAKDIWMVATPGHTLGHTSVLVEACGVSYLLAGDATYDEEQLVKEIPAGAAQNFRRGMETFKRIKRYAADRSLVYLPSHDKAAGDRLAGGNSCRFF